LENKIILVLFPVLLFALTHLHFKNITTPETPSLFAMDSLLIDIPDKKSRKLVEDLVNLLGGQVTTVQIEHKEDFFLQKMIDKGIKGGLADKDSVHKMLSIKQE
jgi:mRNA interferase RelE/StbE